MRLAWTDSSDEDGEEYRIHHPPVLLAELIHFQYEEPFSGPVDYWRLSLATLDYEDELVSESHELEEPASAEEAMEWAEPFVRAFAPDWLEL